MKIKKIKLVKCVSLVLAIGILVGCSQEAFNRTTYNSVQAKESLNNFTGLML